MTYAIKVPFDEEMLYVIEGDSKFQLRVKLFDTLAEANKNAELWGENAIVVEFTEESNLL